VFKKDVCGLRLSNLLLKHAIFTLESSHEWSRMKAPDDCVQVARVVLAKRAADNIFWRHVSMAIKNFPADGSSALVGISPETFYSGQAESIAEYFEIFAAGLVGRIDPELCLAALKIAEEVRFARTTRPAA
jgi:hypothetical protein